MNGKYTILLVEDSENDRAIYRRYLLANEDVDYQILEAAGLAEALERWQAESPDLVLTDIHLPDGNGMELLEAIQNTHPTQKIPVIMMTGQRDKGLAVQAMELGASDYLIKDDITASTLCHYVETAIAQSNLSGKLTEIQQVNQELQELQARFEERTYALEVGESFNRSILGAIPDLLLRLNRDGICLSYMPPKVHQENFEPISRHLSEFLPPDLLERQLQTIEQALITRELQVYEHQVLKNNRIAYEEVRILAINEQEVLAIVRDISDRKQMELSLQQSEEINRVLLETMPDLLIQMDRQGNYIRQSGGQNVRLIEPEGPFCELNVQNILPRHLAQEQLYFSNLALESGTLQIYEQIVDFPDEQRYEEVRIAPVNAQEVLMIIRDISDRKQAEEKLQKTTDRLAIALKSGAIGCWEWDVVNNAALWDERMYELYGVDKKSNSLAECEILVNALHPDDRHSVETLLQQTLLGEAEYNTEFRIVHSDSSIHFIKAYGVIVRDPQGNPQSIIGVNFDISDRKHAEESLKESERRFSTLVSTSPVAIFRFDRPLNCIYVNERWCEMTGRSAASAMGRGWLEAVHPDERDLLRGLIDHEFYSPSSQQLLLTGEGRHLRPDGSINWYYFQVVKEFNEIGEVTGYIGTLTDISDRKQAEAEVQQKNLELEELVKLREETLTMREDMSNMIVHDLRNPLSSMILATGIVQKYIDRVDQRPLILKTLNGIQFSGQRIHKMIDSLLLMAKLESGKIIFNPVPTDLYELGMEVIKDFELMANASQIELQSELPNVGESILIDATILRRVIDNLMSNALKFSSPNGQISLSLEYLPENHLKIKVADTGAGITDEEKKQIFGKFEVGNLKKNTSQTGLGLAFCKMAVDAQGGTIAIADNHPQGTIFIIEI